MESEEQLKKIRQKLQKESNLVRQRAEINTMNLQLKEKNAEARAKRIEETQAIQRSQMTETKELREQAKFDRGIDTLDTYFNRKEKIESRKMERIAEVAQNK